MGKNKLEKLVEVIWVDAASGTINMNDVNKLSIPDYLIERKSYGKIYKENKDGVILINTEDRLGIEYTAIPNGWIKQINYYKNKEE